MISRKAYEIAETLHMPGGYPVTMTPDHIINWYNHLVKERLKQRGPYKQKIEATNYNSLRNRTKRAMHSQGEFESQNCRQLWGSDLEENTKIERQ